METARPSRSGWFGSPFALALLSGLLLWAAFPPLGWWPLAWLAPVGWLILVRRKNLAGWRSYGAIWLAGFLHWLVLLEGIRHAHWALYFGWAALAFYLALYLPAFVGLARVATGRLKVPLLLAAPLIWTGLELARGHLLTGFSVALLGHTQVNWLSLIQISDLVGAYGVSFVILLACAGVVQMLPMEGGRWTKWPAPAIGAVLAAVLLYGHDRLDPHRLDPQEMGPSASESPLQVALIQGSIDTIFEHNPQRDLETFLEYRRLTFEARRERPDLDLIVWPESMFTATMREVVLEEGSSLAEYEGVAEYAGTDGAQLRAAERWAEEFRQSTRHTVAMINTLWQEPEQQARELQISLLVGGTTQHFGPQGSDLYNSALFLDPDGQIVDRYYKMHPVMFGEYIPLGERLPWLYGLTPMAQGLTAGPQPKAFEVAGRQIAPNICFESTVPHLIRRQVLQLQQRGQSPDILVNVTNDGWFWGSSILDLHLTCGVFRAVENRRPLLIAANTGISAWIDGDGRIRQRGPRRDRQVVFAEVALDGRDSYYHKWGDFWAGVCLLFCLVVAAQPVFSQRLRFLSWRRG